MKVSEKELIRLAKKGDPLAQSEIVKNYERMVYNLGLRLLGNEDKAECVLQETFLKVLQALPNFKEQSQLSTWIYRIATNQALMRLRTKKRRMQSFDENIEDESKDYSAFTRSLEKDPLSALLNTELKEKMDIAIDQLPENYKTTFVLKDIEGLALKEIADIMELSLPAVKSNLHRARVTLRNKLADIWN
ncbi:sigma-70 family RNA polymerase sigma factor [candidate division KSB1 bacterium]|nr:sigma-70 family RNA polymerase sigma factor [candidate division KSB1 bacterium]MBL7095734.1 sigma-70 family RNA polymerase sigma factor [candidate division KSB1 bacterium]